jgi:CheY-like chemotaxis protein
MTSILLVDDNDDLRELYGAVLRREGYVVHEAENGQQALTVLERMDSEPCMLLLDLMMPVMSGTDLLKVLHDSGRLAKLPVIVLSAGGRRADVPEAQNFIRKPVDAHVLVALVRELCVSTAHLKA